MLRIFTFLAFSLLAYMQAAAQNLTVTDFRLLENDMRAQRKPYEHYDRNGKKCALIVVVTPQHGFHFDTGMMHLARQEDHPGETWIWVTPMLEHIHIGHDTFGTCSYDIPIVVEGGRTYEMLLDIGTGRFVTVTTTLEGATVVIDGKEAGTSPLYNHYLNMGEHTIVATKDKYEGTLNKLITTGDKDREVLNVTMKDMSSLYGDVVVEAGELTDIFYQGRKVETGTWRTQLKKGTYTVETRMADADPQTTTFQVEAGRENRVTAIPPVPHTGYLHLYTVPRSVQATIDDGQPVNLLERQVLNVGSHQLHLQKKGYYAKDVEYRVARYETTTDTVRLQRIDYVKKLAFYFGGGYTMSSMPGITGILGTVIKRNDLQLSYTFGTSKSENVNWYNANGTWTGTSSYKQNSLALKYGYQFNLLQTLAITPQVGYAYSAMACNVEEGSATYADNASAQLATIGVKLLFVPLHHVYLFAAPQYALTLGKSDGFDMLSKNSDIKADGFSATLGLLLNF